MTSDQAFQILFPADVENGPSLDDVENGLAFNAFWDANQDELLPLDPNDEDALIDLAFEYWNGDE